MRVNTKKRSRRVRFISAWQTYSVGDEIEPTGMHRDWLISRGYCVPIEPEPEIEPELETATVDPVGETTAMRSARSPKGRRPKHEHAVRP